MWAGQSGAAATMLTPCPPPTDSCSCSPHPCTPHPSLFNTLSAANTASLLHCSALAACQPHLAPPWPRCPQVAAGAAAAIAASTPAPGFGGYEPSMDDVPLRREWEAEAVAAHFQQRPLAVAGRAAQVRAAHAGSWPLPLPAPSYAHACSPQTPCLCARLQSPNPLPTPLL